MQPVTLKSGERIARIPGVAFVYTNTYTGIPAAFTNLLKNYPALHEVVIFITIRCSPQVPVQLTLKNQSRWLSSLPTWRFTLSAEMPASSTTSESPQKARAGDSPMHLLVGVCETGYAG